jgi:arsenite methyltransferase
MSETKQIKTAVKEAYSSLATERTITVDQRCCETSAPNAEKLLRYGYSREELSELPESVIVMADGCGNPTGLGMIKEGETVLDLGSGGGIDVFLASKRVGRSGKVIGLDMTPEMIKRANDSARRMNLMNVEFKLGEIEQIPMSDGSVDVIMSNCVICLSTDKERVFREMFRVLKPGGRLAIADEIALRPFSEEEKSDPEKWCKCITGAITETEYASTLERVGFAEVYVKRLRSSMALNSTVFSAFVSAVKSLN